MSWTDKFYDGAELDRANAEVARLDEEVDTLITALRECVVALEGVVGCFDPSEVEEFRTSHEGRSGGEICMGDVVRCWDSVNRAKSTLERYKP